MHGELPPLQTDIDCLTANRLVRLPGLVDVHVHVREPGATHKEDWATATAAALAGGITMIFAMPNTNPAITDMPSFECVKKVSNSRLKCTLCFHHCFYHQLAAARAHCDYCLYVGAGPSNAGLLPALGASAVGLKMYLNKTYTSLTLDNMSVWMEVPTVFL